MNIQRMSARYERILPSKLIAFIFLVPFVVILSRESALGQGFKMTQLNPPGYKAGTTVFFAVNASQNVVGYGTAKSGATVGFLYAGGKYTAIKYPGSDNFTRALGINDAGEVVGDWFESATSVYHGFTYAGGVYKQYDVGGDTPTTDIFGVNSAGDFAGSCGGNGVAEGFVATGANTPQKFYASGTDATYAYAINSSDEVVGEYLDSSNLEHGFYRSAKGTITEIAYPGATQTAAYGINDAGEITGSYFNSSGHTYGFTYIKGKYASTDFATTRGVNSAGAYVGFYWGVDGAPSAIWPRPKPSR